MDENMLKNCSKNRTKTKIIKKFSKLLLSNLFVGKASADPLLPGGSESVLVAFVPILFFAINYAINAIILAVVFRIFNVGFSQKFLIYVFVVTLVGLFIDFVAFTQNSMAAIFTLAFILLFIFNSFFIRFVYEIGEYKAIATGLVMDMLSNPVPYVTLGRIIAG